MADFHIIACSPSPHQDKISVRREVILKRARFTLNQSLYLCDCGFSRIFHNGNFNPILTAADADAILAVVPRNGRTAMSIRRQVASLLRAAEVRAGVTE